MQRPADERLTHDTARQVCERLGVKAMLDGTLARLGQNYVLTLNATDCHTGDSVAREQRESPSREEVLGVLGHDGVDDADASWASRCRQSSSSTCRSSRRRRRRWRR